MAQNIVYLDKDSIIPRMSTWNVHSAAAWRSVIISAWLMCSQLLSCLTLCDPMNSSLPGSSLKSSRQEYWSKLPFPTPGHLPDPEMEPAFLLSPGKSSLVDQFSSVAELCLTLCDSMDCSTAGLPIHHQLLEFTQTHVH